ncbi:histone H1 [Pedobacter sp. KBW01]|nr:histone H1 [Pedobacter sp. KBW01]RQO64402.1 histone H1 [Pedobacter sp. KBW01]
MVISELCNSHLRKAMPDLKVLAQEIRVEVTEKKNSAK